MRQTKKPKNSILSIRLRNKMGEPLMPLLKGAGISPNTYYRRLKRLDDNGQVTRVEQQIDDLTERAAA